jgi:hypothetical protein
VPAGAAADDIAIVHIWLETASTTITGVPSGFTLDTQVNHSGSTRFWQHRQYWKRLTAADTGSYTFTLSQSDGEMGTCALYSGRVTSGSPYDVATVTASAPAGTETLTNCPSTQITTITDGCDLVWAAFPFFSCAAADKPASFTQAAFDVSAVIQAYKENQPPGASGSLTQGTPRTDLWTVQLSALLPAGGSGSTDIYGDTFDDAYGTTGGSVSGSATQPVTITVTAAGTVPSSTDIYSDT